MRIVLATALLVVAALAVTQPAPMPHRLYATCKNEDASDPGQLFPCMWDATRQGNGRGRSFILYEIGGEPLYL